MKCPKCGSEMQEEGEFVSDEDEDVGGSWEGNGIWGCPKCGSEMISTFPEAYIPYKGWVEVEIIVCRNCGHEEKVGEKPEGCPAFDDYGNPILITMTGGKKP